MLERYTEHEADAPAFRVRIVDISQATHILNVENLEDVVHTDDSLYVWLFRVHR